MDGMLPLDSNQPPAGTEENETPRPPSSPLGVRATPPAPSPLGVRPPSPLGIRSPSPPGVRPATPLGPRPAEPASPEPSPLGPRLAVPRPNPATAPAPTAPVRKIAPVYRGLPRPVRYAGFALAAVAIGAVVGLTAPTALRRLGAVAATQPGLLSWYSARAFGIMAYLAIAGSVVYGLLLSTKILDVIAQRPVSFALHKDLSIVGLLLGAIHGTVLLADQSYNFTPRAILVPFASPYSPFWVGLGQLAFYGLAIITASFYVRRQIGQRAWRLLHYLTFLVYIDGTAHGIMAGSDSGAPWAIWLYLVPSAAVVFLLVYRIVLSISAHVLHPSAQRPGVPPLVARAPVATDGRAPGRPAALPEPPLPGLPD